MSKKTQVKNPEESQALPIAILAVAVFGVLLTIIIELSHKYPWIMELCGGSSSGCADVASTPFARIPFPGMANGLSVAYLGLLAYVFFIFCQVYFPRLTLPMASAMMGAELYFMFVMAKILGIFCMFCVIQFVTVTILFLLTLIWAWGRSEDMLPPGGVLASMAVLVIAFVIPTAMATIKPGASVAVDGDILTYAGDTNSRFRVEIYSDFQCPYCKKIEPEVDKLLEKRPDVLVVFRDYIIPSHRLSPYAVSFANAVAILHGREAFMKIRREMFHNQGRLRAFLESKTDMVKFDDELRARIQKKVDNDLKIAHGMNIYSTPTIVIYRDGKMAQIIQAADAKYEKIERFLKP